MGCLARRVRLLPIPRSNPTRVAVFASSRRGCGSSQKGTATRLCRSSHPDGRSSRALYDAIVEPKPRHPLETMRRSPDGGTQAASGRHWPEKAGSAMHPARTPSQSNHQPRTWAAVSPKGRTGVQSGPRARQRIRNIRPLDANNRTVRSTGRPTISTRTRKSGQHGAARSPLDPACGEGVDSACWLNVERAPATELFKIDRFRSGADTCKL